MSVMQTRADFPEGFLWGTATAAYQIEGAASEGGRGPSIWDTFSHTVGTTHDGHTGDVATDHYHRFAEDVDLMAEIGTNAYRFSISWSRIMPTGTGEVNEEGVAFYRRLCEALIERGITPVATLYHWDLPQSLQDMGGWVNPDSVEWFAEYARMAKDRLGDLIRIWSTLNEPHCSAFIGNSEGRHAPGLTDPGEAFVVAHHLMLAHHAGIRVMRETNVHDDDQLGIVLNIIPAWPDDPSEESKRAANGVDAIHNRLFAAAVLDGKYPDQVLELADRFGVADRIDVGALAAVRQPIDYLGVNYYNINHIAHEQGAPMIGMWPGVDDARLATPPGELTEMGWGVEPIGLTWMLNRVAGWAPGLPLMIMENGAAYVDEIADDGAIHDHERRDYIAAHIQAMQDAMLEGVDVRGYFVWSLLDNFEWARGYETRFGLVHVDYDTLERRIKDSGYWYQKFLAG